MPTRARDEGALAQGGAQEKRIRFEESTAAPASASDAAETMQPTKRPEAQKDDSKDSEHVGQDGSETDDRSFGYVPTCLQRMEPRSRPIDACGKGKRSLMELLCDGKMREDRSTKNKVGSVYVIQVRNHRKLCRTLGTVWTRISWQRMMTKGLDP